MKDVVRTCDVGNYRFGTAQSSSRIGRKVQEPSHRYCVGSYFEQRVSLEGLLMSR